MAAEGGRRTIGPPPRHKPHVASALLTSHRIAGARVGGYRIESLIAHGGMSEVYKAFDPKLGRTVALKLLPPFMAESEWVRDRFLREARIAASLEHPHVVPIYDAGRRGGVLWIAMRYIEGTDLRTLIEKDGPLGTRRILVILRQIASALDAAHDAGLVHRDVKPHNILIIPGTDRHSEDEAFLSDFGLAKALESGSRSTSRAFIGTVNYVSPEQIRGNRVDRRSDVYSLGCVLYECLTGTVPFARDSDVSVLWAHVEDDVTPASERRHDLPSSVDAVIGRALAKAPDDRFSGCGDLVSAYRSALRCKRGVPVRNRQGTRASDHSSTMAIPAHSDGNRRALGTRSWVRSLAATFAAVALSASGVYAFTRVIAPDDNRVSAQATEDKEVRDPGTDGSTRRTRRSDRARPSHRSVGGHKRTQHNQPAPQALIPADATDVANPGATSVRPPAAPSANALTRTATGEYTGSAPDGLVPSNCLGEDTVGCVFFKARADERYLHVSVTDKLGASVRVWIRQNYDSDPNYDGEWSMVCNESNKAIRIVPDAEINVLIQRGECADGSTSRPSVGTVTASFYSRRP